MTLRQPLEIFVLKLIKDNFLPIVVAVGDVLVRVPEPVFVGLVWVRVVGYVQVVDSDGVP